MLCDPLVAKVKWLITQLILVFQRNVTEFTDLQHFLAIIYLSLFTEVIHCRIYQSVKSQWKWEDSSVLLLLPWRVLLLIDLYSYLYLLINLPGTMCLAFLLINFFTRSIFLWYLPRLKTFYLSLDIYFITARVKYESKFLIQCTIKKKLKSQNKGYLSWKL